MAKIYLHIITSVDGRIEDADGGIDWFPQHEAIERHMADMLASIDGMVFGNKAHAMLAQYWPEAEQDPDSDSVRREQARLMNALPKYVLSRSGRIADWQNSHPLQPDLAKAVSGLRQRHDRDIAVFAGAGAARAFLDLDLLDECRLLVAPVVLGGGKALFADHAGQRRLSLLARKEFPDGSAWSRYQLAPKAGEGAGDE